MLNLDEIHWNQEQRDAERRIEQEREQVRERKPLRPEQRQRQHRIRDAAFHDHEQHERHGAQHDRPNHHHVGATPRPFEQSEHEAAEAGDREHRTSPVDAAAARSIVAFRDEAHGEHDHDRRERHVQEEDRSPAHMFDQPPADNRPQRRCDGAEARPRSNRAAAIGIIECGADDGKAPRDEKRGTDPLQRASGNQRASRAGEPAQHRRDREEADAGEKDALAPELIAQRAADKDERTEEQRVGLDDPLHFGDRGVEIGLQRGERHVDHGRVDERHARPDDRGGQRPAPR